MQAQKFYWAVRKITTSKKNEIKYLKKKYENQQSFTNSSIYAISNSNIKHCTLVSKLITKNSNWYLNSCILFHMISFMKIFIEIKSFDNDNVNMITDQEIKLTQINIIQINLNDKMLEMKNV